MSSINRALVALMLVLATAFGAVALVGCGGASSSAESASAASESASQDAAAGSETDGSDSSDEQADCYGDDLPAVKSGQSS